MLSFWRPVSPARTKTGFRNQIMMEHALFIRGQLDPSEEALIETADDFSKDYKRLLQMAKCRDCAAMGHMTAASLEETRKYRDFKATQLLQ